ncbi:MAG: hypothetical protein LBP53_00550 [Candidatus Peribacteria bacterium]|jgi:hypothetical protein|nr:hypothetical protein [Candidatus Peribacteria bacterium]
MQHYIELLQGYYKFLFLGKFFETEAKSKLFALSHNLPIATGEHTKFSINADLTSSLLAEIHKHARSKNVFGYLVEISAFRGIFSVMREMIENIPSFRAALKSIFADQYLAFEQTIRFLRNVLSHSSTPSLIIQQEDFQKQKEFLASQKVKKVRLHFVYKQHLPEWEGSEEYACDAEIDFAVLKAQTSLRKVVSLHQMYMLSELCYNISKVITGRTKKITKKKP